MAQKVISVSVNATPNGDFQEMDFPKLTAALEEGYEVKQIETLTPVGGTNKCFVIFVLVK